jgi:hypothetical protein
MSRIIDLKKSLIRCGICEGWLRQAAFHDKWFCQDCGEQVTYLALVEQAIAEGKYE